MNKKSNKEPEKKESALKTLLLKKQQANGVLGKDISSRFATRVSRNQKPTKWGGRNGSGKPS